MQWKRLSYLLVWILFWGWIWFSYPALRPSWWIYVLFVLGFIAIEVVLILWFSPSKPFEEKLSEEERELPFEAPSSWREDRDEGHGQLDEGEEGGV